MSATTTHLDEGAIQRKSCVPATTTSGIPWGLTSSIASGMLLGVMGDDQRQGTAKVDENRVRRMAERQGLRLEKSRRRDPLALGFGTYGLIDIETERIVFGPAGGMYGRRLEEVEAFLAASDPTAVGHTRIEIPIGTALPPVHRCICGQPTMLIRSAKDTTWLACASRSQEIELSVS